MFGKTKNEENKKGLFTRSLVKLLAAAFVLSSFAIIIVNNRDCAEKQKELDALEERISAYELENADLQRILDSDDLSPYMERIAIEERGYAYPDERRFYDKSRD